MTTTLHRPPTAATVANAPSPDRPSPDEASLAPPGHRGESRMTTVLLRVPLTAEVVAYGPRHPHVIPARPATLTNRSSA
jgi:hypothetical protein